MYLMSTMALQHGARSVLYDGSPFLPDLKAFIRLVGEQKVTDLGISPRYLQTLASASPPVIPKEVTDLSNLRRVSSTGMVLPESLFYWFYDSGFPPSVHLNNISGGTDVASSFAMGNLLTPLYAGGCQGPGLAMNLQVYDQTIEGGKGIKGKPLPIGEAGELVVTSAFPNQPVKFWGDTSGQKYFDAYYARFDSNSPSPSSLTAQPLLISSTDVWTHGDYIFIHPKTGGVYFLGRADGVLNPSGVRFGSAEIYNVLETFFADDIQDSICVGQRRPSDNDESVMLFLLMKPGKKFHEQLVKEVKRRIGKECSPRHVPRFVFETKEIPVSWRLQDVREKIILIFCRRRSISRKWSCRSRGLFLAKRSHRQEHCLIRRVWSTTTNSPRWKNWSVSRVSCKIEILVGASIEEEGRRQKLLRHYNYSYSIQSLMPTNELHLFQR